MDVRNPIQNTTPPPNHANTNNEVGKMATDTSSKSKIVFYSKKEKIHYNLFPLAILI